MLDHFSNLEKKCGANWMVKENNAQGIKLKTTKPYLVLDVDS